LQVPDEAAHFFRSFRTAEGAFVLHKEGPVTGDNLPKAFARLAAGFGRLEARPEYKTSSDHILTTMGTPIDTADREFFGFSNTSIHPPLIYLPQAIGILLGRLFSETLLAAYYGGRLANLVVSAALMFIAIRRAPVGQWAFAALALAPMSLILMASLSSDAVTNAISFLLIAQVLKCAFGNDEFVSRYDVVLLLSLGAALGLTKQAYFFLSFSFLLIPVTRFRTRARYWTAFAAVVLATLLTTAGWALVVRDIYSPAVPGKVDAAAQWQYLVAHPQHALQMALTNATIELPRTVAECFGVLAVRGLDLPTWIILLELAIVLVACLISITQGATISRRQTLVSLGIAVTEFFLILLIINLTWDKVGYNRRVDVQGRYFIPLAPLLAVSFIGIVSPLARAIGGRLKTLTVSCPGGVIESEAPESRSRSWGSGASLSAGVPAILTAGAIASLAGAVLFIFDSYYVDSPAAAAERAFVDGQNCLRTPGQQGLAINHFNEALRWNPAHAGAHYNLGVLLARTDARVAIQHYQAAIAADPSFFEAQINLANGLSREADFDEAAKHFRAALDLRPDAQNARSSLANVQAAAARQAEALARLTSVITACARSTLGEPRYAGAARQGIYLRASAGPVLTSEGKPPVANAPYVWRSLPPSGEEIRLEPVAIDSPRPPFFACGLSSGAKRVFVFLPPLNAQLLYDDDVSWYYQARMVDLTPAERENELAFRERKALRFPLDLKTMASQK
jgi:hypothetical protein